ncbi:MAG: hypothetical protein E7231_08395 [Cellulosilyticum sp.]|nr:hypothetical protein [Cellulosilyticum sp.]
MNGKKVLNQLIKLFIVINIVLFIVNYAYKGNQYVLSGKRIQNITSLLEQKGISIETELLRNFAPKYSAQLMFLGNSVEVRGEIVKQFFGKQLASVKRSTEISPKNANETIFYYMLGDETLGFDHYEISYTNLANKGVDERPTSEEAKRLCEAFITRIGPISQDQAYQIEEEIYDHYWKLTYYPMIEGIPVLDSYMTFEVYKMGVAKATLKLADIEITSERKQDICALDLVLFGIEDEILAQGGSVIRAISMCYKSDEEENVLGQQIVPTYKIEIEGLEEPIFVNAYSNEIMTFYFPT